MWDVLTFTIDGEDAKDLDDAISFSKKEYGTFEVGVHIADVSHYIKKKSPLDKEALNRGTSVYLVDRVIPMLPKKLSNGICSLHPHTDKLCFSVIFTIKKDGRISDFEIRETIINSDHRFTYQKVQEIIESNDLETSPENEAIKFLNNFAQSYRKKKNW